MLELTKFIFSSVNSLSAKSTATTPGSSVIPPYNNTGPPTPTSSAHPGNSPLLSPYGNVPGQPIAASLYSGSSLSYPAKIPGLIPPPSSWPHPSSLATSVQSPVTTIAGPRSLQTTPSSNSSAPFAAPLPPPPAVPTSTANSVNSHPFSTESLLTNKRKSNFLFE